MLCITCSAKSANTLLSYIIELRICPGDTGQDYRNVIGIPGGSSGALYSNIQKNNVHGMELIDGMGGTNGDTQDNYVVYVYDSLAFPFFRAETFHQFHTNDVLNRPVPTSYTVQLKQVKALLNLQYKNICTHIVF